jgi:hypothetical protein
MDAYLRLRRVVIETRKMLEEPDLYEFTAGDVALIEKLVSFYKFILLEMPLGDSLESRFVSDDDPRLKVIE